MWNTGSISSLTRAIRGVAIPVTVSPMVDLSRPETGPAKGPDERRDLPRGVVASEISNAVVRLFAEYLGRGPTKARAVIATDLIAVVLEDTLTRAERKLIERNQQQLVLNTRRVLQQTMRRDLVAAVEELSGRRVIAFLSDQESDPDIAVETFVLEPLPAVEGGEKEEAATA
jgi:uncharacterized protein YbcI